MLVVINGGKALAKAVRNVFGANAIVQRCQAHKVRNVVDQLPEEMNPSVRQALRDAYAASDHDRARTMLANLARRLRDDHPGASASLEEGLDETISVKRLRLPKKLECQLATTNAIENLMGSVRELARRVKRWRGGRMIVRWTVTAVVDASTRFRRITGARDGMTQLMRALAQHENTSTSGTATRAKAAPATQTDSTAAQAIWFMSNDSCFSALANPVLAQRLMDEQLETHWPAALTMIGRLLRLLRAHGIIKKIPKTHRYQLSERGRLLTAALRATRDANLNELLGKAA